MTQESPIMRSNDTGAMASAPTNEPKTHRNNAHFGKREKEKARGGQVYSYREVHAQNYVDIATQKSV